MESPRPRAAVAAPASERLVFTRFEAEDAPQLAALLADPEVARSITTNGSTAERCLASARNRIGWHNGAWETRGFGVWALRERQDSGAARQRIVGWCGFAPADDETEEDPEVLYGLARDRWGRGLGSEAVRAALAWLFEKTGNKGVSAVIAARLNPGSVAVVKKLGLVERGRQSFEELLPNKTLALDVLDYELWRLREGATLDPVALLFQAPYKAGQLATLSIAEAEDIEWRLIEAVQRRTDYQGADPRALAERVRAAFRQGLAEPYWQVYRLARENWRG